MTQTIAKVLFGKREASRSASLGLLSIRLAAGAGLLVHGLPKLATPMSWMGDAVPGFFQFLAVLSEVGGGAALIVGLLVPLASLGILSTMAVATYTHLTTTGSPELALLYGAMALTLFFAGPGIYAIDEVAGDWVRGLFGAKNSKFSGGSITY